VAAVSGILQSRDLEDTVLMRMSAGSPSNGLHTDFYREGSDNNSNYDDPIFEDLLARFDVSGKEDVSVQNDLLKQLNNYLVADLAHIFLPARNSFRFAWPWIKNYEGEAMTRYMVSINIYSIAWIDQDMKAEMGY